MARRLASMGAGNTREAASRTNEHGLSLFCWQVAPCRLLRGHPKLNLGSKKEIP